MSTTIIHHARANAAQAQGKLVRLSDSDPAVESEERQEGEQREEQETHMEEGDDDCSDNDNHVNDAEIQSSAGFTTTQKRKAARGKCQARGMESTRKAEHNEPAECVSCHVEVLAWDASSG